MSTAGQGHQINERGTLGISPQYAFAEISSSSLQLQSDDAQLAGRGASDPLPWCGALEVGSPGMELPCDDVSDSGSAPGDQAATGERMTAASQNRVGAAVGTEDSAQFGPEASAMSLPGRSCISLLRTTKRTMNRDHPWLAL